MKRINYIWIAWLLVLLQPVSAQEVTTVSGYPVIDLSALSTLGATLTKSEADARLTEMNAQTVSNTAFVSPRGEAVSGHNGTWNTRTSFKFQVMRANLESDTYWNTAWSSCKTYNGEGGGAGTWRLPTQRELQMIWCLHPQLIGIGGFTAFSANYYWTSTEYNTNNAWCVRFANGNVGAYDKAGSFYVRCVRDLP